MINLVWYMNGATHIGSGALTPVADQNWKIMGVADINSDGKPDLLWRNTVTGTNVVWYMNGTAATAATLDAVSDQNMEIAGQGNN